jgi:hypothetical protein
MEESQKRKFRQRIQRIKHCCVDIGIICHGNQGLATRD